MLKYRRKQLVWISRIFLPAGVAQKPLALVLSAEWLVFSQSTLHWKAYIGTDHKNGEG